MNEHKRVHSLESSSFRQVSTRESQVSFQESQIITQENASAGQTLICILVMIYILLQ